MEEQYVETYPESATRILSQTLCFTFNFDALYEDSKHKSEICRAAYRPNVKECRFSKKCDFAHAIDELKPRVFDLINFKKQPCRGFETGCPYKTRCLYLHDEKIYDLHEGITLLYSRTEKKFRMIRDQGNGTVCVFTIDSECSPKDELGMKVLNTLRDYVDEKFEKISNQNGGPKKIECPPTKPSPPPPSVPKKRQMPLKRVVRTVPVEPAEPEKKTEETEVLPDLGLPESLPETCILASIPSQDVSPTHKPEAPDYAKDSSGAANLQAHQQNTYPNTNIYHPSPVPLPPQAPIVQAQPYAYPNGVNPYLPPYQQFIQQHPPFYHPIQSNFPQTFLEMSPTPPPHMSPTPIYYVSASPYQCYAAPAYQVPNVQPASSMTSKPGFHEVFFPDGCGVKLPPSPPLSSCDGKEGSEYAESPASMERKQPLSKSKQKVVN